jgi:hypothetical protein
MQLLCRFVAVLDHMCELACGGPAVWCVLHLWLGAASVGLALATCAGL